MVKLKSVCNFLKAMDPLFYELVLPLQFSIFQESFFKFSDYFSDSCAICWLKVKCRSCGIF